MSLELKMIDEIGSLGRSVTEIQQSLKGQQLKLAALEDLLTELAQDESVEIEPALDSVQMAERIGFLGAIQFIYNPIAVKPTSPIRTSALLQAKEIIQLQADLANALGRIQMLEAKAESHLVDHGKDQLLGHSSEPIASKCNQE